MSRVIGHHYHLEEIIGRGGMGVVYRGIDARTGAPVAVKWLRSDVVADAPETVERFVREGEALRQLNHPNIVKMLEAIREQDQHYLVMEYVDGGDLHELLQQTCPFPIPRLLTIAIELADALARAHYLGIIHRDLKPANVLIAADGTPRLTDFGVAHLPADLRITDAGLIVGTLDYLSPEALRGEVVDTRTDIWAFGVLLYELLAGKHPFRSIDTPQPIILRILTEPVPELEQQRPDAPVALVDLIYRMLEKDRNARIRSVRQVGLELEAIIQGEAIGTSLSSTIQVDARFAPALPATELPKHALPAQTTAFVGREAEMAELMRWLSTAPSRLLTILAPGGIGKTRLALEFSRRVLEAPPSRSGRSVRRFDDGIYFVPLASLSDSTQIIPAIADVIGCQLQPGGPEPAQQLLGYLRRKRMLLTLDNLEHLLDGIAFLAGILQAAPEVHILTTSREKLGLSDETVFALNSLTVQNWQTVEEALDFPAVQLFMQHARRSCPGFELTNENLDAVTRICQLVQGMPLGIILATGWLGLMSPQEIAAEITCSLDFLETEMRDVPERQRSIRAVFEQAWNLLNMQEQDVIQRLSVFRGGFTREAAQAVTGASLRTLASLTNKALLWRNPHAGRFEMHELLRHYAEELLEASDEADMARDAHSAYYAGILHWYEPVLHGRVPSDSTSLEAVRSAIQTGFQNTYAAAYPLADLLDPLTEREIEILELVSAGYSNRDIALKLVISVSTVKTHLNRAYNKLSVKSRTQAIRQAKALHILAS